MLLKIIFFILGFIFLIKGADFLVEGSSSIAKKLKISSLVIGLTIVSFGTSAPELLVNIMASFKDSNDIAIGNIIGSNISNIFLILGAAAIIYPLSIKKGTTWKEIPFSLLAIFVVWLLLNDQLIDGANLSILSRIDGMILLCFFIIFIYYTFGISKIEGEEKQNIAEKSILVSVLMIVVGMLGLYFGGDWIIDGAVFFAEKIGLSEAFIGLTIIAFGTSLPELAASCIAAYKKDPDIAIGNVVGSNIFNVFWILGISSAIKPISFATSFNFDFAVVGLATVLLFIFIFIGKKHILHRWQGILFILFYITYIGLLIYRI